MEKLSIGQKASIGVIAGLSALSINGDLVGAESVPPTTECIERESDYPPSPPCDTVPPKTVPTTVPETTTTNVPEMDLPETGSELENNLKLAGVVLGLGVAISGVSAFSRRRNAKS